MKLRNIFVYFFISGQMQFFIGLAVLLAAVTAAQSTSYTILHDHNVFFGVFILLNRRKDSWTIQNWDIYALSPLYTWRNGRRAFIIQTAYWFCVLIWFQTTNKTQIRNILMTHWLNEQWAVTILLPIAQYYECEHFQNGPVESNEIEYIYVHILTCQIRPQTSLILRDES